MVPIYESSLRNLLHIRSRNIPWTTTDLPVLGRGHSHAASPAHDWNCTSSSSQAGSTCRSSRCAARRSRASRLLGWRTHAFAPRADGSLGPASTQIAKERVALAAPTPLPMPRKPAESSTNRLENYLTRVHTTIAGRRQPAELFDPTPFTQHSLDYDSSPCARPWALVRGKPGAQLELHVEFLGGRKHLPVVTLRRAA